ncbi:hypothetical protein [Frankia sp. QA3]|uniref:hypothetical protein n=1 Tax=Frankia sp. QA3 TaxID=710111 RepID=UPI0012FCDE15|nr:hypothetical protein [Frankia sp. QA3]
MALVVVLVGLLIPGTAAAAVPDPEVWAGSPVAGSWNTDAATHHWLANAADQGDWATDIAVGAGTPVAVYVAPQNGGYDVATRVDQIGAACRAGDGASFVTVGIYTNGVRVGSITYGHVRPGVQAGQWVGRWGAVIGTVADGLPYDANCWTGPHVHLQMFNVHNYSCFNRGYGTNYHVDATNFVGFSGGRRVGGAGQACP